MADDSIHADNSIQIELSPSYVVVSVVLSILTLGLYYVIFWRAGVPRYPVVIDSVGLTLRDGSRVEWSQATKVKTFAYEAMWVYFGKQRVVIAPGAIKRGPEVAAIVKSKTEHLR